MTDCIPTPERQKQILSLLSQHGRLSVAEIVSQFSISEATARRDLETLALQTDQGLRQARFTMTQLAARDGNN